MIAPEIMRYESHGVTMLGDTTCPFGVALGFTERTGGVSEGVYASLNLGEHCGDDAGAVAENRKRALVALGAGGLITHLVCPRQVHGDHVVTIRASDDQTVMAAQTEVAKGADAVVCTARNVPVLLCYADCVPVILVVPGGFAVVHSGWRGTIARVVGKALRQLLARTDTNVQELAGYIGPHIGADDYQVSPELAGCFEEQFGPDVVRSENHLNLEYAVRCVMSECGVKEKQVASVNVSTATHTDRFYSWRAESGVCGRHGALAVMLEIP